MTMSNCQGVSSFFDIRLRNSALLRNYDDLQRVHFFRLKVNIFSFVERIPCSQK